MAVLKKSGEARYTNTICGFDKNHFSKPVLLSYSKGYIAYRDLIAIHQIENSIISIENQGLKSSKYHKSYSVNRKLPDAYSQSLIFKFNQWVELLGHRKIKAGAILDIIIDGKTFVYVDRRFRKSNGWARDNFVKGVQCWNIKDY